MAQILIVSVDDSLPEYDPFRHCAVTAVRTSATVDPFGLHTVTEDPEKANVILFVEMGMCGIFQERVRAHELYRRYPEKCFVFDTGDTVRPIVAGMYASVRKEDYSPDHTRTGFYLMPPNKFIGHRPLTGNEPNLMAFVGSYNTHPVRESFAQLQRSDIFIQDSSKESYTIRHKGTPQEQEQFWARYADSVQDALFSLCPRGRGPGSIRLYESMKMGRASVVLSDDWVPNDGVDWDSCIIRVPEADVAKLPALLDSMRDRAKEMGDRARQEWEKWFADELIFHHIAEACLSIMSKRKRHGWLRRMIDLREIVRPSNLRLYLISKRRLYQYNRRIYW